MLLATGAMGQAKMDVESGLTLRLEAPMDHNGVRQFFLNFRTNDVYECSNHHLTNDVKLEGDKLIIKIKGIRAGKPCLEEMGPATAKIDLSTLTKGNYKVKFWVNRQSFKGKLEVAEGHYDLRVDDEDPALLRIYNGRLNLIPANTVWGICAYADPAKKAEARKFMAEMQKAGAQKAAIAAGNYGEFYLHHDGATSEKVVKGDQYEYPFVYSFAGDMAALKEVASAYRDKVRVTLKNSKGEVFQNWQ